METKESEKSGRKRSGTVALGRTTLAALSALELTEAVGRTQRSVAELQQLAKEAETDTRLSPSSRATLSLRLRRQMTGAKMSAEGRAPLLGGTKKETDRASQLVENAAMRRRASSLRFSYGRLPPLRSREKEGPQQRPRSRMYIEACSKGGVIPRVSRQIDPMLEQRLGESARILNLSGRPMGDGECAAFLSRTLMARKEEKEEGAVGSEVRLRGCGVGNLGLAVLWSEEFYLLRGVSVLDLGGNHLSHAVSELCAFLVWPESRVRKLLVDDCKLSDDELARILDALTPQRAAAAAREAGRVSISTQVRRSSVQPAGSWQHIEEFSASFNDSGKETAICATKMMRTCRTLEVLRLAWGNFTASDLPGLTEGIRAAQWLTRLDLGWQAIGNLGRVEGGVEGMREFGEVLAKHPSLQHLDLSFCSLSREDCLVLGRELEVNRKILGLDFEGNSGGFADVRGYIRPSDEEMESARLGISYDRALASHRQLTTFSPTGRRPDTRAGGVLRSRLLPPPAMKPLSPRPRSRLNGCWICDGFREVRFEYIPGESGPPGEAIYVHTSCSGWRGERMDLVEEEEAAAIETPSSSTTTTTTTTKKHQQQNNIVKSYDPTSPTGTLVTDSPIFWSQTSPKAKSPPSSPLRKHSTTTTDDEDEPTEISSPHKRRPVKRFVRWQALPPGEILYLFSVDGVPQFALNLAAVHHPQALPIPVPNAETVTMPPNSIVNAFVLGADQGIPAGTHCHPRQWAAPYESEALQEAWSFERSVFAPFQRDTEQVLDSTFAATLEISRFENLAANFDEMDAKVALQVLRANWAMIKGVFKEYALNGPMVYGMDRSDFFCFTSDCDIEEEGNPRLDRAALNVLFVASNFEFNKFRHSNTKFLGRHQFLDAIVRLAIASEGGSSKVDTLNGAIERFLASKVRPNAHWFDSEAWRRTRLYVEDVDIEYRLRLPAIRQAFHILASRHPREPHRPICISIAEWRALFDEFPLAEDHLCLARDIDAAFVRGKQTLEDEMRSDDFREMIFVEFLEAIAHISEFRTLRRNGVRRMWRPVANVAAAVARLAFADQLREEDDDEVVKVDEDKLFENKESFSGGEDQESFLSGGEAQDQHSPPKKSDSSPELVRSFSSIVLAIQRAEKDSTKKSRKVHAPGGPGVDYATDIALRPELTRVLQAISEWAESTSSSDVRRIASFSSVVGEL